MRPKHLALCAIALALASSAEATPLHLQLHGLSWHQRDSYVVTDTVTGAPMRRERFNPYNIGAGLRLNLSESTSVQAGAYRHSFASRAPDRTDRDWATYALADWLPAQAAGWRLGASAGMVKGYPPRAPGWRPLASLTGRLQGDRLSLTLRATYGSEGGVILAADLGVRL